MTKPVFIFRPEPGNSASCARASKLGLEPISIPLFRIESVPWESPDPKNYTAIMMTSANAARFAGAQLGQFTHIPLFAVGAVTAASARDSGFASVVSGEQNVAHLLATFATLGPQKILHLCGEDRVVLASSGLEVDERVVYRSVPIPRDLTNLFSVSKPVVCLVHSPRAGERFAELCDAQHVEKSKISIVAISEAAERALGPGWEKVAIAANPRDDAMLQLALELA
jgi:uroporphyrinogen-III synthase